MAIFRLQITSIARGSGPSSVGAAAYRAGERIRDDRTNEVHNHSRRKDVTHSEIMLPTDLAGQNMDWALNRASLWNSVENAESRKNSRVAREIQVTLPFELAPERRLAMARSFSQEIADHYKVAVDLAVHDPRPSGDPRNFHAHLLLTTREVSAAGLGPKTGLDLQTSERVRLGLPNISQEFTAIRERWATLTNEALKEANIEARVDHRSLAEQGIDREPKPHIPFAAYKIERAGKHSEVAESIRADYNARVQARQEQAAERLPDHMPNHTPERAPDQQPDGLRGPVQTRAANPGPTSSSARTPSSAPQSLEDIRREARENWLKMRAEQTGKSADRSTATSAAHALDQPHTSDTRAASAPDQPHAATTRATAAGAHTPSPSRAAAGPAPPTRQPHSPQNTSTPDNDYQP
jgi:ATP-dependent exoDNAse (exonuclease V) alpha subunit